jgi:probable rRNA maturation factor
MAILNKKHLHREGTTDVISFPLTETSLRADKIASEFVEYTPERKQLGDIFISYPQAVKQAKQKMIPTEEEVVYLAQHGVLHLLGIHHK